MTKRLDVYLVEKHFIKSRERAKRAILSGLVMVDGHIAGKPSQLIIGNETIVLTEEEEFVGRGGLKLKKAIESFHLNLENRVCMDIGASTGGFSDCMLKNGASKIYAVDVGQDQLDEKLRCDSRIVNLEKTDARNLNPQDFLDVTFISSDVSFISICLILPTIAKLLKDNGESVILIKPQFEAGRAHIGKGGIVKDKKVHFEVIQKVLESARLHGLTPKNLTFSPISNGNIEYLLYLMKEKEGNENIENEKIKDVISEAFAFFDV